MAKALHGRVLAAAALALGALAVLPVNGEVTTASPAPRVFAVPTHSSTTLAVVWSVAQVQPQSSPPAPAAVARLLSPRGEFRLGMIVLGTVERPLSPPAESGATARTVTFTETLTVPRSIAFRAAKSGASRIRYVREFSDADGRATAILELPLTGSGAAFADNDLPRRVGPD